MVTQHILLIIGFIPVWLSTTGNKIIEPNSTVFICFGFLLSRLLFKQVTTGFSLGLSELGLDKNLSMDLN